MSERVSKASAGVVHYFGVPFRFCSLSGTSETWETSRRRGHALSVPPDRLVGYALATHLRRRSGRFAGMEHTRQIAELAHCIEEHNELARRARELWAQAQERSQRIGTLVGTALSTGTSWAELGRLLATVDNALPASGLAPHNSPDGEQPSRGRAPAAAEPHVPVQGGNVGVSRQREHAGHEDVPQLLVRAHAVVSAVPEKEMASRDLAAALEYHPNTIGPDLCAIMREVGIMRPNRGKINARYDGGTGGRLPGFTAACLKQAVDAYVAQATASDMPTTGR